MEESIKLVRMYLGEDVEVIHRTLYRYLLDIATCGLIIITQLHLHWRQDNNAIPGHKHGACEWAER